MKTPKSEMQHIARESPTREHIHRRAFAELRRAIAEEMRASRYSWREIAHQLGMKNSRSAQSLMWKPHEPGTEGVKTCTKCSTEKAMDLFPPSSRSSNGRASWCRSCLNQVKKKYRQSEAGAARIVEYKRHYYKHHPENQAQYAAQTIHARRAHCVVYRALKSGKLTKTPCEVCAATRRVEGHHDDYSKQLEVRWLCPTHHRARHAELAALGIDPDATATPEQRDPRDQRHVARPAPASAPKPCANCGRIYHSKVSARKHASMCLPARSQI